MLDRLRGRLESALSYLGRIASKLGLSPTHYTVISLLLAIISAYIFSRSGSLSELLGGILIMLSGIFDIIDGAVARVTGSVTRSGAFMDSTLDRLGEFFIYLGILIGSYIEGELALIALSLSLLVSYTRARGDSLGVDLSGVGIGERSERLIILSLSSILGYVRYGVIIVIIISAITFAERIYRAIVILSKE